MKNKSITLNPQEAWEIFKAIRSATSIGNLSEMDTLRLKNKLKKLVVRYYPAQENAKL